MSFSADSRHCGKATGSGCVGHPQFSLAGLAGFPQPV